MICGILEGAQAPFFIEPCRMPDSLPMMHLQAEGSYRLVACSFKETPGSCRGSITILFQDHGKTCGCAAAVPEPLIVHSAL